MDRISDLHAKPKGTEIEIQGEITYDSAPKQVRYGQGFSQFIVVHDSGEGALGGIGCNVPLSNVDQGYRKGETVTVRGKLDKYADRKQPLLPNGTYPVKTSVKVEHIEEFTQIQNYPEEEVPASPTNVMSKEDVREANKPPRNGYIIAKEVEEEKKRIIFEKKDLITAKESACKTVGKWIESGKMELKDYFKWCNYLVDYFYNEDDKFAIITEANLMISGLITVTKAEALNWIEMHLKGTDVAQDVTGILHVKALDKQTLNELLETIGKLSLVI